MASISSSSAAVGVHSAAAALALTCSALVAPAMAERRRRWGRWAGLTLACGVAGTLGAFVTHELYSMHHIHFGSAQSANFGGAIVAFVADAVVTVAVSLVTQPKPAAELEGLVWGTERKDAVDDFVAGDEAWYRSPWLLGIGALVLVVILNIIFI